MRKVKFSSKQKKKLKKPLHSFIDFAKKLLEIIKLVKDIFNP